MADEGPRSDAEWYRVVAGKSSEAEGYFQKYEEYGKIPEVLGFQYGLLDSASWLRIRYNGGKTIDVPDSEPITVSAKYPRRAIMAYTSYVKNFFRLWSIHKSILAGMPYVHHVFRVLGESVLGQYYIACYADEFDKKTDQFIECVENESSSPERVLHSTLHRCHNAHLGITPAYLRKKLYTPQKASRMGKVYSAWSAEDVHFNPRVWRDEDPKETLYDMWAFLSFSVHNVVSFVETYKTVESKETIRDTVGPFMEKFRYMLTDFEPDLIPDVPEHDFLWSLGRQRGP